MGVADSRCRVIKLSLTTVFTYSRLNISSVCLYRVPSPVSACFGVEDSRLCALVLVCFANASYPVPVCFLSFPPPPLQSSSLIALAISRHIGCSNTSQSSFLSCPCKIRISWLLLTFRQMLVWCRHSDQHLVAKTTLWFWLHIPFPSSSGQGVYSVALRATRIYSSCYDACMTMQHLITCWTFWKSLFP
jgi:hypothetical protein